MSNIPTTKRSTNKLQLERPEFTIYADAEIISESKAGSISTEVRHRLIRGTMHNMVASCASFNRLPYVSEIEEMAKSLVITYPCLGDAETGHVSNVFFTYFFFDNWVCYTWRGGILVTINKTLIESSCQYL